MAQKDETIIDATIEPVDGKPGAPSGFGWKAPLAVLIVAGLGVAAYENWPRLQPLLQDLMTPGSNRTAPAATPATAPATASASAPQTAPQAAPSGTFARPEPQRDASAIASPASASPASASDAASGFEMRFDALEQRLRQTERALESAGELARQRNDALHLLEQRLAAQETKLSESDARGAAAEARLVATEARLAATEKRLSELAEKRASSEAQAAAEALALVRLRMAALAGNAFGPELKALESMHDTGAGDDAASLETLRSVAQRGAPVLSALQARFGGLAREALRQAQQAAAQSLWERIYARMTSLVLLRRTGDVAGDEPDAVLARAELRLKNNDLAGALAEVKKLGGPARAVLEPWIEEAQHRLDLEAALAMLEARALARLGGR